MKNAGNETGSWLRRGLTTMLAMFAAALLASGPAAHARQPVVHVFHGDGATFTCQQAGQGTHDVEIVRTSLAGVPAILRVPGHASKPPIVLWHGFGAPSSPQALMDALPLDSVPAVKVYLGLPLFGARAPAGGTRELIRRQKQDFAKLLFKPSVVSAADELPAVVAALQQKHCMNKGDSIGLFGFSAGGSSALIALAQHKVAVGTAVVLNASTGLNASVQALERVTKQTYVWTPAARKLAENSDAIQNARDIAHGNPPPALLILQGADDKVLTPQPAIALHKALLPWYRQTPDRLQLDVVPGLGHGWTKSPDADQLRGKIVAWFAGHQ